MKPFSQYLYENTDEYRQLDELADELISELSSGTMKSYVKKSQARREPYDIEARVKGYKDGTISHEQDRKMLKKYDSLLIKSHGSEQLAKRKIARKDGTLPRPPKSKPWAFQRPSKGNK